MTEPHHAEAGVRLFHGDCLDILRELPAASVDAVVTDPPYGLGFMGREWDTYGGVKPPSQVDVDYTPSAAKGFLGPGRGMKISDSARGNVAFGDWCELWAAECLRVLKPGGHLLAFGGTRTFHRLACAVEDAGFEIRDSIAWLYGSGFPKSLDVSKAIDKAAGAEREPDDYTGANHLNAVYGNGMGGGITLTKGAPATDDARTWQGWGTALKPAFEPIVVARKPLGGRTVAANVLTHGTGALNIDATRIGDEVLPAMTAGQARIGTFERGVMVTPERTGRWPANVVLDESQADTLDQQSGNVNGAASNGKRLGNGYSEGFGEQDQTPGYADAGGASRFFFVARQALGEVGTGIGGGSDPASTEATPWVNRSEDRPEDSPAPTSPGFMYTAKADASERVKVDGIAHPTVKPISLMRWLVRLVTPPGGTVLEPFAGSGTTVEACILEGFHCIAIEREADYLPLIRQRINRRLNPVEAVRGTGEDGGLFDLLSEEPA